ncbi:NAD-dependent dehydratase [Candidatus Peregrinibacteria bacterium RIFOXYA12_FULL_33_12]|nr:MAG: NAD-dependent dehydratase [Candidatus Peregrinibacteria bacterium RIFOXYA12_FULL_33_12]
MNKNIKIIIPGAAGLVGQNLIFQLKGKGYKNIIGIDMHKKNLRILKKLHPDITTIESDISSDSKYEKYCKNADIIIMLQAQITAKNKELFIKNNIVSTEKIIKTAKKYNIPYILHISSSVVISVAKDNYTNTKKIQENLIIKSGIKYCILRPTLMFGWFDRKHLGWLSRFMKKIPIFPIPGNGKYLRQPLYVKDFCNIIIKALEERPLNEIYNITGKESVDYIDIIKEIKKVTNSKTIILKLPYLIFYYLLKLYSVFDKNPPFTADQLKALCAGDKFPFYNWWDRFDINPTPFKTAIHETFTNKKFSKYILDL